MMMPPPMPVPTVTTVSSSTSAPAPNRNSPQAAALPSFSTTTGIPTLASRIARTGTCDQPRFGAKNTVARDASTGPATPRPTPTTDPSWGAPSSRTTSETTLSTSVASFRGVGRRAVLTTLPESSTRPARIFVPPTSTPMLNVTAPAYGRPLRRSAVHQSAPGQGRSIGHHRSGARTHLRWRCPHSTAPGPHPTPERHGT